MDIFLLVMIFVLFIALFFAFSSFIFLAPKEKHK